MKARTGEKIGWLVGWAGGFLWILPLALLFSRPRAAAHRSGRARACRSWLRRRGFLQAMALPQHALLAIAAGTLPADAGRGALGNLGFRHRIGRGVVLVAWTPAAACPVTACDDRLAALGVMGLDQTLVTPTAIPPADVDDHGRRWSGGSKSWRLRKPRPSPGRIWVATASGRLAERLDEARVRWRPRILRACHRLS